LLIKTSNQLLIAVILAFAVTIASKAAQSPGNERSGKEVVEATCVSCHKTGEHGAPKIGDKQAWAKRASRGFSSLTQSALKGIRQMPPHGANMALTDTEIKEQTIFVFSQRQHDPAAMDKLFDIAKNEKDPELRKKAIFWLGQSRDPRAQQFLIDLINK